MGPYNTFVLYHWLHDNKMIRTCSKGACGGLSEGRSTLLRNGSASDLDVKRNPVPRDASVEQNPTGSGIGLGARRPPGPVCFLEKSDWLKLVLVAGMPEPAR